MNATSHQPSPLPASGLLLTVLGPPLVVASFMVFPRTDLGMLCGALILAALLIVYARAHAQRLSNIGILLVVMQLACALALATGALFHLSGVGGNGRSFEAGLALGGSVAVMLATVYLRPRLATMPYTAALAMAAIIIVGVGSTARLRPLATSPWWAALALASIAVVMSAWVRGRDRLPAAANLIGLEALGLGALGFVLMAANADAIRVPGGWLDFLAGLVVTTINVAFLLQHARSAHRSLIVVAANLAVIGVAAMVFSLARHLLPAEEWPIALGSTLLAAGVAGAGAVLLALIVFAWLQLRRGRSPEQEAAGLGPDLALRAVWLPAVQTLGGMLAGAWMLIVYCCIFAAAAARLGPADLLAAVPWTLPPLGERLFVETAFRDRYLWYREATAGAPRLPRATQDRFSYVAPSADYDAWFLESRFVGVGVGLAPDRNGAAITYVVKGSPADLAGFQRGQRVIAVNGRSARDMISTESIGAGRIDAVLELLVASSADNQSAIRLQSTWVEEREAVLFRNFLRDGRRIGYLFARNLNPSAAREISNAITELQYSDVSELVLDLRYAGSGSSAVALHLASLVAGKAIEGKVLTRFVHNDKYRDLDHADVSAPQQISLDLGRVVVITSPATCGAAEWLINGLKPHMQVVTVGGMTCGCPIGMKALQFRDQKLVVATTRVLNANGEGEYFQGIPPRCPAADDLTQPLGRTEEASLREALRFLATGTCSESGQQPAASSPRVSPPLVLDLRAVIGLY